MYVRYTLKTQQALSLSWVFKKLSSILCASEDEEAGSFDCAHLSRHACMCRCVAEAQDRDTAPYLRNYLQGETTQVW